MSGMSEAKRRTEADRTRELAETARENGKHALADWLDECADKEERGDV